MLKPMQLGYVRKKAVHALISTRFLASKPVTLAASSALWETPGPPANAAPSSYTPNVLLVMKTWLRHVHIAVARKY